MLHKSLSILLAVLCTCGKTWAQRNEIGHLVPIPAYHADGYDQAVFSTLIGRGPPKLWMVCKPSFSPEYALILRSELINPAAKDPYSSTEPRQWILETVTATKPIWHWKSNPDGSENLDILKEVPVVRKRLEIDESLAKALQQAWESMLRQTHYCEENPAGLDGTTYQFYCHYDLFGQIWSPESGLPADLVSLSGHLTKLVESTTELRPALQKECLDAAQRLECATKEQKEKAGR